MNVSVDKDESFLTGIRAASAKARDHADAVDRDARFPIEAVDMLRGSAALGAAVPCQLGGGGVSFGALCSACFELSRSCASTGMVFAMHQIQLASITRHIGQSDFLRTYLSNIVRDGRLIGSVTAEEGTGGDLRQSVAALELLEGERARFEKAASAVSYGAYADDLLVTLRRSPSAERNDQILALVHAHQTTMNQVDEWDTLGMRGTCSPALSVRAELSTQQLVPEPFGIIAAETMVPYAHILWSYCWLGIATDAADRARSYARANWKAAPTAASRTTRLSHLSVELSGMRNAVHAARGEYELIKDGPARQELSTVGYTLRINNLKIATSVALVGVCCEALGICGLAGYRNGSKFSVGRNLRDALSAPLMVSNDRIHMTNAHLLLLSDGA